MLSPAASVRGRKSQRLLRALEAELATGQYRAGDQYHTIDALCTKYSISPPTVNKCLDRLVSLGVLERHQGSGTYIRDVSALGPVSGSEELQQAVPSDSARLDGDARKHAFCYVDVITPGDIRDRDPTGPDFVGDLIRRLSSESDDAREFMLRLSHFPVSLRSADEVKAWFQRRIDSGARAFILRWMPLIAQRVVAENQWPTCMCGTPYGGVDLPYVDHDQYQLGIESGKYFKQLGCQRVGLITRLELRPGDNLFLNGLLAELGSNLVRIESCCPEDEEIDRTIRTMLESSPGVDGLWIRTFGAGQWLPANYTELHRSGRLKGVMANWRWHPGMAVADRNLSDVMDKTGAIVAQLLKGQRVNPLANLLDVQILPPIGK